MSNLVSGMILIEKKYGDIHYLISTPFGYRSIDLDGEIIEFNPKNYTKAYIPVSYEDGCMRTPMEGTEIIFGGSDNA